MVDTRHLAILYLANDMNPAQDRPPNHNDFSDRIETLRDALHGVRVDSTWTCRHLYAFKPEEHVLNTFDCIIIEQLHAGEHHNTTAEPDVPRALNTRCIELVELLQRSENLPPIIVLSNDNSRELIHQLKQRQVSQFIFRDGEGYYLQQLSAFLHSSAHAPPPKAHAENEPHRVQRLNRNLLLLNQVGQMLTSTLDTGEIAAQFVETVTQLIDTEGSTVWLFEDSEERYLICQAAYSAGKHVPPGQLRLSPGEGLAGWTAEYGQTAIVTDAMQDERFSDRVDNTLQFQTHSLLTVPLRARNEIIGVLQLVNKKNLPFDQDDCILAETLASSTAIAMENARLIEALRQRNAELEQRNLDLDAYSDTVAHDLKNPITHFLSYADDLSENYSVMSQAEIESHLGIILQQSRRMSNIIDELLLLARVRTVEDLEIYPLDMLFILEVVEHRVRAEIQDVQIQLADPDSWPQSLGYAPWIEGVWYNYISNGLKYGGDPPEILVGAHAADDGTVHFWVRDNGRGLEPEEIEKLFEPFPKLRHNRKKGHGLGLVIVRRIVARLGGSSWVESTPGEGSTFYFSLPQA